MFKKVKCREQIKINYWISVKLLKNKDEITNLTKIYRRLKIPELKLMIQNKEKKYYTNVIKAKHDFYSSLLRRSSNVCKTSWKIINNEIGPKNDVKQKNFRLRYNGILVNNPSDVARVFNEY